MSEGVTNHPLFPIADSSLRVQLPSGTDPVTGESIRGPDGLRAATVVFPRVAVNYGSRNASAEDRWQPIAAVAVAQCVAPTSPGADAIIIDALSRVSFWLKGLVWDSPGERPNVPPVMDFDIRAASTGSGGTGESTGTIVAGGWDNTGLIAQVSGLLCSQWELWMRLRDVADADLQIKVRIDASVDRMGGSAVSVEYGPLVGTHTP